MRVLVVTHYFPPEVGAPQARLSDLVARWASAGEQVTVLTSMPSHPTGVVPPRYRRRLRVVEEIDGYRVVRTWVYATPNQGVLRKTFGHLSFMLTSVLLGGRAVRDADVVVVSSPTFLSIFAAWFLARWRRARFVVEVRDLWPAIFVELGVLTNATVIRFLSALEMWAYRAADAVVVVTRGFRDDLVGRGVPASKVHTIPNGADVERFGIRLTHARLVDVRQRLGVPLGEVLVLYAGAHGISHALGTLVEAALKVSGDGIHVALVGEGAEKAKIARMVDELQPGNVSLHHAVRSDEVPGLLAAADIVVVPLRDVPLFKTFVPSKLFEALAAGKPVIGCVRGEAAQILAGAGALVIEPEDPGALAGAIRELAGDHARRAAMAKRGRAYVSERYDRGRLAETYRDLLHTVAAPS